MSEWIDGNIGWPDAPSSSVDDIDQLTGDIERLCAVLANKALPPAPISLCHAAASFTPWTAADSARLVEYYDNGLSIRKIASKVGRSRTEVQAQLVRLFMPQR